MTNMEMRTIPSLGRKSLHGTGRFLAWVFRTVMKLALVLIFLTGGLFIGGFLQFTSKVSNYSMPINVPPAQGIVVLTGGSARIAQALDLLAEQKGERLLISGVNPGTRKQDLRAINPSHEALFGCCVDLERVAEDTIGNAVETRKWMEAKNYDTLILVTSGYHMPRSLLEFRRQMPNIEITAYPVTFEKLNHDDWWKNSETLRFMLSEYSKYVGAWSRDYFNPETLSALRATAFGS